MFTRSFRNRLSAILLLACVLTIVVMIVSSQEPKARFGSFQNSIAKAKIDGTFICPVIVNPSEFVINGKKRQFTNAWIEYGKFTDKPGILSWAWICSFFGEPKIRYLCLTTSQGTWDDIPYIQVVGISKFQWYFYSTPSDLSETAFGAELFDEDFQSRHLKIAIQSQSKKSFETELRLTW